MRLGEVLALRACDIDFKDDAIHIRGTINKKGEIVPAKADSERTLAMAPFLRDLLSTWFEMQQKEFPTLVKRWRREKIPCGKTWDETAPVCSSYYGTHLNTDNFGKWMRSLMVERGLGEYTTKEEWVDSRGIKREKLGGYVGPSFKSLRSFGATYLISEKFDVKTAQGHLGHRRPTTTLGMYAESVPAHEREVASAMYSFIKNAINKQGPIQPQEDKSLSALQNAIIEQNPEEWPEWVQELVAIASEKNKAS